MNNRTVEYELDLGNLPPLTKSQKAELEALRQSSDEEINYSNIPALGVDFWKAAVRNPFYKPKKAATTVRVDVDVLLAQIQWEGRKGLPDQNQRHFARGHVKGCVEKVI